MTPQTGPVRSHPRNDPPKRIRRATAPNGSTDQDLAFSMKGTFVSTQDIGLAVDDATQKDPLVSSNVLESEGALLFSPTPGHLISDPPFGTK